MGGRGTYLRRLHLQFLSSDHEWINLVYTLEIWQEKKLATFDDSRLSHLLDMRVLKLMHIRCNKLPCNCRKLVCRHIALFTFA